MWSRGLQTQTEALAMQTEVLSVVLGGNRVHRSRGRRDCSRPGSLTGLPQPLSAASGISPHPSSAHGLLLRWFEAVLYGFEPPVLGSEASSTSSLQEACCLLLPLLLLLLFISLLNLGKTSGQWVLCIYLLCEIGFLWS